jgi:hypothetical protein
VFFKLQEGKLIYFPLAKIKLIACVILDAWWNCLQLLVLFLEVSPLDIAVKPNSYFGTPIEHRAAF